MSININSRETKIINILKNAVEPISGVALSEEIGCSTKTIQSDIKNINKVLVKSEIVSIRGKGYKLKGNFEELDIKNDIYDDINRESYILKKMINLSNCNDNYIRIEDLADLMYVSLSTVKNDLKEVKKKLNDNNIKVETKHKQGIYISGSEDNIIKFIINICNDKSNNLNLNDFLITEVINNIFKIKHNILEVLEKESLLITDLEFKNILDYILISLSRNSIDKDNLINKYINNYKEKRNKIINNDSNKEKIKKAIKIFCENLKIATNIDITEDKIFEECLDSHISNLCKKNELGISESYPISANEIKLKYAFAFELAKIAKKTIEDNLEISINEEEIGNIALHIGGAIERANQNTKKKIYKVVIVCTSGIGTSMLIKSKLENLFYNKIEIVKVIPAYLIDYINIIDVDFVISTVPIELENIPLIKISPLLNEKEVKIIEKYLETEKVYSNLSIQSLLERDLFFTNLIFDTKEKIIEYMADALIEKEYIDEEMKQSFFDREKIATTEIGNMVAIPHGAKGKIFKNRIAIGILRKPIKWEINEVKLVIMIAIDTEFVLNYEELFSDIYKRVDSIAKVINICENQSFDKFRNMFN